MRVLLAGNTNDCKTLRMFLDKIEKQYGRARRVWVMDRGIPTEPVLAEMPGRDPPVQYLVGTPKERLSRLKKAAPGQALGNKPAKASRSNCWQTTVNFTSSLKSDDRVAKNVRCAGGWLKWLWKRLRELTGMEVSREEMLMKLGAARAKAPTAWRLVDIEMDEESPTFTYALNRKKLRRARRREGRYLLRTNLTENDPTLLWRCCISSSLPWNRHSKT